MPEERLEFTGNWFIDLGILGFVNLMEEVYGWDLDKLRTEMDQNNEIVFYNLFPVAYFQKWLKDRNQPISKEISSNMSEEVKSKISANSKEEILNYAWWSFIVPMFKELWINKKIENVLKGDYKKKQLKNFWENEVKKLESAQNLEEEIKKLISNHQDKLKKILNRKKEIKALDLSDLEKILNTDDIGEEIRNKVSESLNDLKDNLGEVWDVIPKRKESFEFIESTSFRLPIDSGFFKNFMFFNQSKGLKKQKEDLLKLINFELDEEYLKKIDKTINKLFPSLDEFGNIFYTEFPSKTFKSTNPRLFSCLLCFPYAFGKVNTNISFYSNSLEFTCRVNKKIKEYLSWTEQEKNNILKITWQKVIDTLWEMKSVWALENMYLVQYRRLDNQVQEDVEYIGISKLQAEILIDDKIRDALNAYIKISEQGNKAYCWLLEEFLKNKPLLPLFYRTLRLYFAGNINSFPSEVMIYSAAVDKVISELNWEKDKFLFSEEFFNRHKSVVEVIKENIRIYFGLKSSVASLFSGPDKQKEKESLAYQLFGRLKKDHKYGFVNEALKALNSLDEKKNIDFVVSHLFNNILQNDISWQSDAVPIIAGLISKGGEEDEE